MLSFHLPRHRTLQTGIIGFYEEIKGEGDTNTQGLGEFVPGQPHLSAHRAEF